MIGALFIVLATAFAATCFMVHRETTGTGRVLLGHYLVFSAWVTWDLTWLIDGGTTTFDWSATGFELLTAQLAYTWSFSAMAGFLAAWLVYRRKALKYIKSIGAVESAFAAAASRMERGF